MRKNSKTNAFYIAVQIITIILLVASTIRLFVAQDASYVSEYTFIAINALVLLLLTYVQYGFKKFKLELPHVLLNIYLMFITAGFLLGEIGGFYANVPWWDDVLHFSSGGLITFVAFSFFHLLTRKYDGFKLSPIFMALFAFCFAMTVGVMWEIVEFTIDSFADGSNMQRFMDSITLVPFVGQDALYDTMHDFILNGLGSLIITIVGFFDLKYNKNLFNCFHIKQPTHPLVQTTEPEKLVLKPENKKQDKPLNTK